MDKFSELIKNGVAAFNHQTIAPEIPVVCPLCRTYNNTFGAATDTHMSPLEDGTWIITGHIISDHKKFDRFLWASTYAGVNFDHSGYNSLTQMMYQNHLAGRYDVVNGDNVYILYNADTDGPRDIKPAVSFTTNVSSIPQSVRFATTSGKVSDMQECYKETVDETVAKLNESRYVLGNNWNPVYTSEGVKMTCNINGILYLLS